MKENDGPYSNRHIYTLYIEIFTLFLKNQEVICIYILIHTDIVLPLKMFLPVVIFMQGNLRYFLQTYYFSEKRLNNAGLVLLFISSIGKQKQMCVWYMCVDSVYECVV